MRVIWQLCSIILVISTKIEFGNSEKQTSKDELPHVSHNRSSLQNTTVGKEKHHTEKLCERLTTCAKCSQIQDCVWCNNIRRCKKFLMSHILQNDKKCKSMDGVLKGVEWSICHINNRTIAIAVGSATLVIVILLCCCLVKFCRCVKDCVYFFCCCCCCSGEGSSARKEERRLKRIEKHLERQARRQELLLKLGVSNAPYGSTKGYSKFEDTPI